MSDQSQEKILAKKREKEDCALSESASVYIPLKKNRDEDFTRVRKHLIKNFALNKIAFLKAELQTGVFSTIFINKFFEEEYHAILHWLLIGSDNTSSFQFVLDTFTPQALKGKLRENNFSFLGDVLNARAGMEELGLLTMEKRALDCERFKLLIKIDPDGIHEFMKEKETASFMKESIMEDYETAKKELNIKAKDGKISPSMQSPKQSPKLF